MKDGVMRSIAAGALMGAGALWAMSTMSQSQKQRLSNFASQTASKMMGKANEMIGK